MNEEQLKEWRESTSMGFVDRRGRPVSNQDAEKMLCDMDYRRVGLDEFDVDSKPVRVSTVFLGIPHIKGLFEEGEACYETLIEGGKHDKFLRRWDNAGVAAKAHESIVKSLKNGDDLPFEDANVFTKFFEFLDKKQAEDNAGEEWKVSITPPTRGGACSIPLESNRLIDISPT